MNMNMPAMRQWLAFMLLTLGLCQGLVAEAAEKRLAYLVSDQRIPFWDIMQRGISTRADALGYHINVYSAGNNGKHELEFMVQAIRDKVDGIILSPTNSSAAVTLLKLAKEAGIPVVIADIGTDSGDYVSYISSDNRQGAYEIGKVLVNALKEKGWEKGSVGIVAIPQKRTNGRARTAGFMKALEEAGIRGAGIRQQADFSYDETYKFTLDLLESDPGIRAIWLQGSDRYQAALDAVTVAGRKDQVLLVCFDAEPEFLVMIPQGSLVGAAMQQPFLMGETAVDSMHAHLQARPVKHEQLMPILAVSRKNLRQLQPLIQRNVLGSTKANP